MKRVLTKQERTQAIIDGFRGKPREYYMLTGLLVASSYVANVANASISEAIEFDSKIDRVMLTNRILTITKR